MVLDLRVWSAAGVRHEVRAPSCRALRRSIINTASIAGLQPVGVDRLFSAPKPPFAMTAWPPPTSAAESSGEASFQA